jgi:bacterioferritin-associated ferredoxin
MSLRTGYPQKSLALADELRQNHNLNDNDSHSGQVGNYRTVHLTEGAKMIVCVCNNISDREIRQAVDLGLASMDELRRDLGVATCCGKCASYAADVLATHIDRIGASTSISATTSVTELSFRSRQAA